MGHWWASDIAQSNNHECYLFTLLFNLYKNTSKYGFTIRMHLSPTSKLGYLSFNINIKTFLGFGLTYRYVFMSYQLQKTMVLQTANVESTIDMFINILKFHQILHSISNAHKECEHNNSLLSCSSSAGM